MTSSPGKKLKSDNVGHLQQVAVPKHHPLIFPTFLLACFLFVLPTHADMAWSMIHHGVLGQAILFSGVCLLLVGFLLVQTMVQIRKQPNRYKSRRLLTVTQVIWLLAATWTFFLYAWPILHTMSQSV